MTPTRVGEALKGKRSITEGMALRLARFCGTSPEFWLNMQQRYNLVETRRSMAREIEAITPYEKTTAPR